MKSAVATALEREEGGARPRRPARPPTVAWRSTRRLPTYPPAVFADWIAAQDWAIYRSALEVAHRCQIPYAIGGGLAVSLYTGQWRPMRDLDLYVLPDAREALIDALLASGLADLYDAKPYDRKWIFRAVRNDVIVDVIWAMANGAGQVERRWLTSGARAELDGVELPLLAPEEVLWSKLHVLQRDRCDWPDLLNLLYTQGPLLHWSRLLTLIAGEERLLGSLLHLFAWVAPARAQALPAWLWGRLELASPDRLEPIMRDTHRIRLLDSRPWFTEVDV